MKKVKLCSLFLLMLLLSCSKEEQIEEELSMEVEFLSQKFEVDQAITLNIKSNQDIFRFGISKDYGGYNFGVFGDYEGYINSSIENHGKSIDITFTLDKIGKNVFNIFIQNQQNEILERNIEIDIKKGNAVKIKSLKMISFRKINEVYDPEYSNTDINRLADLQFEFDKKIIGASFNKEIRYWHKLWHQSEVLENQGSLTWDLSKHDLYIDPNLDVTFDLHDKDKNGYNTVIVWYFMHKYFFNLKEYIKDKPSKVILKRDDLELEMELELIW